MMERKTHPSERGWDISDLLSGYGTQSDTKQKQVEANSLELSMKPEAQTIASGVGG
jgi:hypothetical protein